MRPPHRTSAQRRHVSLLAALVLPVVLMAGCGGDAEPDPESYAVTDLGGTGLPEPLVPLKTKTKRPTSTPTPSPTATPTSKPAKPTKTAEPKFTKGDLIAQIGAAVGALSAVHLDLSDQQSAAAVLIDLNYGSGAMALTFPPASSGASEVEVRRISGRLYFDLGDGDGWQQVAPNDPRLARNSEGILPRILAFDLLDDLRTTFVEGSDFQVLGRGDLNGTTVDLYRLTLDLSALAQPSLILQAGTTGSVTVDIAIDLNDRPVRIDYGASSGTISSLVFTKWGVPVSVPVPPLG